MAMSTGWLEDSFSLETYRRHIVLLCPVFLRILSRQVRLRHNTLKVMDEG